MARFKTSTKIQFVVLMVITLLLCIPPCFAADTKHKSIAYKRIKPSHRTHHQAAKKKQRKKSLPLSQTPVIPRADLMHENATNFRTELITSIEQRLIEFVHETIATLRYSAYKLGGTHFDNSRGIYIVDCSDYVDNILQTIYPHAYWNLVNSTGSDKPTTEHYYHFFNELSDNTHYYWNKIEDVDQLQPGDILVFRYKNATGDETSGHVMVVMDKPIRDTDTVLIRVTDSAPHGHSEDTRPRHVSGIGIGTLMLKVDPDTGQPAAYAWKIGSSWKKNVNIAMARPINAGQS